MFLGEFEYRIDDKGRMPVPPKFRADLKAGVILTSSPERCILGYTGNEWRKLAEQITGTYLPTFKLRKLTRALFATAFDLSLDSQGRVALPVSLRQYAGIDEDAIIVGANKYFEIWNRSLWQEEKTSVQEQAWQIIESLEKH